MAHPERFPKFKSPGPEENIEYVFEGKVVNGLLEHGGLERRVVIGLQHGRPFTKPSAFCDGTHRPRTRWALFVAHGLYPQESGEQIDTVEIPFVCARRR